MVFLQRRPRAVTYEDGLRKLLYAIATGRAGTARETMLDDALAALDPDDRICHVRDIEIIAACCETDPTPERNDRLAEAINLAVAAQMVALGQPIRSGATDAGQLAEVRALR